MLRSTLKKDHSAERARKGLGDWETGHYSPVREIMEPFNYSHGRDQLHNLWNLVQKENAGFLVQKLRISKERQRSIKLSMRLCVAI